jgi:hypothetical protein
MIKGNLEENCGERKTEDGFCHLDRGCHRCERQSKVEDTSRRPYSLGGKKEFIKSSSKVKSTGFYFG